MKSGKTGTGLVLAGASAIAMVACGGGDGPPSGSYGGAGPAPYASGASSGGMPPQLVDVDTNQTLSQPGGQGVGVYVEYRAGGHWHVWWTCDTSLTGLSCGFQIGISTSAAIANLASQAFETGDQLSQGAMSQVTATTTTTTGVDGVTFDTPPGGTVTLDAQVDGQRQIGGKSFIFFVENGQPNGGYTGPVADPLMLEPTSP
ncbi:MAG TPA: hypothetical protein VKU41_03120 [Polyangiaceae bacterium]|nr:hypothetical protein [Polyangiaceae bacterium]